MSQQQIDPFEDNDEDLEDDDRQPTQQQRRRRETPDIRDLRRKAKRHDELEAEIAEIKRERALEKAGLKTPDGRDLTERQIKALLATHDGEMTADALRATALDLGFVTPSEQEQERTEALATEDRIAQAAAGAGTPRAGVLTPADVQAWSTEKLMQFRSQHPTEFEALKRGEEVTVGATW